MDAADTGDGDAALLARYGAGDPLAARAVADRFLPLALRFAARLLPDRTEAEDVAQEAMIRLYRAAPGWRDQGARVTTWLYRVVANLVTDRLRRRPALPLDQAMEVAAPLPAPEDRMTDAVRAERLQAALQGLPERQRMALVLRHIEGLSNPEIADILDVGVEAVESLTARAKRALAETLRPERAALGYGS